ncbi:MAG: baseplate J/gp47 family protein [Fusobacterium sp.]|uniref:baseplate J/gp47 family protein n=1 Tax=Fusobacterium sp. TaxID=68766 RepID=UPI002A749620|nr:baseplate J/gp47 family protein [Fusobacterium sp.]MDY3059272.1 baseplate J/gp47 family protein [Fusobacterium sp.]
MQYGVTEKGFVAKTYAEILKEMETSGKSKFGQEWELDLYTPEGALLMIVGDQIAKAWNGIREAYFANYLDYSTGIQLDYHGKSESPPVIRGEGTYATTTLEFTTNKEMTIPKWTIVKKRGTNSTYTTTSALNITSSLKGRVQAIATGYGKEYNAIIGDITELGNNITGVISVTNITPATGGDGIEKDIYYRERIKRNRQNRSGSTVETITSELLKLKTINNVLVLENPTDQTDSNGIAPGNIRIYIDGIDSKEVAQVIHKFKAAGIDSEGDREYSIENVGGQLVKERFYMMNKKQLYIKIEIKSYTESIVNESIKQDIKNVIKDYVEKAQKSGLKTQIKRIVTNQIEARAYSVSDNILELTAKIGLSPNPTESNNLDITIGDYYYCDDSTIEVI